MISILIYSLAIFLGGALFVYGGYDDSPGGQLLGAVLAIIGVVLIYRSVKRR